MPRPYRKSGFSKQPEKWAAKSRYDEHVETPHRAGPRYEAPRSHAGYQPNQGNETHQAPSPNERHRADVIKKKVVQNQSHAVAETETEVCDQSVTVEHPTEFKQETMAGKQVRKDSRQKYRRTQKSKEPQSQTASRSPWQRASRSKSFTQPEVRRPRTDAPKVESPRASIIREKPVNRSIKTVPRSVRSTADTIKSPAQVSQAAAQNARKASQVAQTVKQAGKKTEQSVRKQAAKLSREALKAIMAALKSLKTILGSGGAVVIMVLVVTLLVGMLLASPFGIFFRGTDDSDMTIQTVIVELNNELAQRITDIESSVPHDDVRKDGHSAAMKDVLAVYAVKITTDPDNPLDAIEMDEERKAILTDIFRAMNTISHSTETYTEEETVEVDVEGEDGETHTEEQTQTVEKTRLIITISGKTAQEMAAELGFTDVQLRYLEELLSDEYAQLWYGLPMGGSNDIVHVALSQVGNVGGQPYWSWYGFSYRVSWCACFVSWCADQCGYLEAGILPRHSLVDDGIAWFQERGQWRDKNYIPEPGTIIYFDWEPDGSPDHVGIVEYCDGNYVHTIEGNTRGDVCKQNVYAVGEYDIYGYGVYQTD